MIAKKDYFIAAVVGILVGISAIPTLYNLGVRNAVFFIVLPFVLAPLWAFGVWFGKFLSRWIPFFAQFGKFAAVGFLSSAIDFGVLNILNILSGIHSGLIIGGVNVPGFSVAVINSYLWNKLWVFEDKGQSVFSDFPKFLAVSVAGLLLNSGIIVVITTYIHPFFGLGAEKWLNVAKVAATAMVLVWNFLGYKFVVFRKPPETTRAPL